MNIKGVLFLCLFLACILAAPVQSQTPAPTAISNPTTNLAACGLPVGFARFSSTATVDTFRMSADCTAADSYSPTNSYLSFDSGTFTINGNGHSIIGTTNNRVIWVRGGATLNLNNVVFDNTGNSGLPLIQVQGGATLNIRDTTFQNNVGRGVRLEGTGTIAFTNVQFLNNQQQHAATGFIHIFASTPVPNTNARATINNAIFTGNTGANNVVVNNGGYLTFSGCLTFSNNNAQTGENPEPSGNYDGSNITVPQTLIPCSPNFVTPTATFTPSPSPSPGPTLPPGAKQARQTMSASSATARPMAVTCHDLSQASGIIVRATYGLASGVQCQRLNGGGIGVLAIVEAGFIDAVDIWGYVEQGVEVCFPQAGDLLFLDARMAPRVPAPLAARITNGITCTTIATPGSIVLIPAD